MPQLDSSTFWGIVGIIGVVAGIIGSYLPNRKVIKYHIACTEIITATATKIPGLMVRLDDKPIRNLILTTITFQNVGYQTITSSDIAQLEPLGAHISGECFGYVPNSSNLNSALTVTQTMIAPEGIQAGCTLDLHFDFLKRNDDLRIFLWHDGTVSVRGELKFGKLKSADKNKKDLIWCIYMELIYVANIVMLSSYGITMIQSCDWALPHSVLEVLWYILVFFSIVWEIVFTIANIEAFYWVSK